MWLTLLQACSSNTFVLSKVSLGVLNVLFRIVRSYVRIQIGRKNSERRSFQKLKSLPSMKGVRLGRTSELSLAESVRLPLFDDQLHDDMEKKKTTLASVTHEFTFVQLRLGREKTFIQS